jgi:pimeloyl-ACP methyl ester carboxylesterase
VPEGYAEYIGTGLTLRRATLATNARQVNSLRSHLVLMADAYPGLDRPVEIVHGTADTIVPHDIHAVPLSRVLPDAQLTLLPGVGHMAHHADPEAVVAAVDRAAGRAGLR